MRLAYGVLLAGCALSFGPQAAGASSCVKPVKQKIIFEKGAACWSYSGKATHFEGQFAAGQKLTVKMSGELHEYNEKTKATATRWTSRVPSIDGPQSFHAEGDFNRDDGMLELTAPRDGVYQFSFYPCAMWHNPGKVQICATTLPPKP